MMPPHDLAQSSIIDLLAFLSLDDRKEFFCEQIATNRWVPVWGYKEQEFTRDVSVGGSPRRARLTEDLVLFCELIPQPQVPEVLEDSEWDMNDDPQAICGYVHIGDRRTYARFGDERGRELLVLHRQFHGVAPDHLEIAESFRLWHNLRKEERDDGSEAYVRYDECGDANDVVRVQPSTHTVEVERSALLHFLAARQMQLAIYFSTSRKSSVPWGDVVMARDRWEEAFAERSAHMRWAAIPHELDSTSSPWRSHTQLTGKKLIGGSGIVSNPLDDDSDHDVQEQFVVDVDEHGSHILAPCDPDVLDGKKGLRPEGAWYLTPVFFRREVLARYQNQPTKYTIRDSRLTCGSLWGIDIDNHHQRHVVVFLGDLGRDLPKKERQYWRTFNIPPDGGLSSTFGRRMLLGEWTETRRPEFVFKAAYEKLNSSWEKRFGWVLFLPPARGDDHLMTSLHAPITEEQQEFDQQVLHLTKLLVDSLNESKIAEDLEGLPANAKGLDKLTRFLASTAPGTEEQVGFLRLLQGLRSSGAAHRKGDTYTKAMVKLGIHGKSRHFGFERLLSRAVLFLAALSDVNPATSEKANA